MTPGFKPFTVLLCSGYANALFTGKRFILWIVSSTFGPTGTWTAKQAIYNCRPERLRSELNYLTANQFICTERPHKEWYSMFICLVQRLNCMWQIFYLLDESTSSRFNHYNRIKRSTILKTYIVAVKCKKKKFTRLAEERQWRKPAPLTERALYRLDSRPSEASCQFPWDPECASLISSAFSLLANPHLGFSEPIPLLHCRYVKISKFILFGGKLSKSAFEQSGTSGRR